MTWASRSEPDASGRTSPEELIAAAHAACFCMALSHGLAQAGNPPEKLDVSATSTFVPGTGITQMKLDVTGTVPGLDEAAFITAAEGTRQLPRLGRAEGQRGDPARRPPRELGGNGGRVAVARSSQGVASSRSKISRASATPLALVQLALLEQRDREPEGDAELAEPLGGGLVAGCRLLRGGRGSAWPGRRGTAAGSRGERSRSRRAAPRSSPTRPKRTPPRLPRRGPA